ncbi:hypothetical protein ACOKFD_01085 [Flagellimonas sp. S174]|uniref:hypothetical protein n=1 Tax=Flagellimonas sp. S174 TaxID=3410790 RepID=UPI003BF4E94B
MNRTSLFLVMLAMMLQACWLKSEKEFTYGKQDRLLLKGSGVNSIPSNMALPNENTIVDLIKMHSRMDSVSKCNERLEKVLDSSQKYTVFVGTNTFFADNGEVANNPCQFVFVINGNYDRAGLISKLTNDTAEEINLLDGAPFSLTLVDTEVFLFTDKKPDTLQLKLYDQYTRDGVLHGFE